MKGDAVRRPIAGQGFYVVSPATDRWLVLGVSLTLFLAAFLIRLFVAQRQPLWVDELYHILAGHSLREGRGFQLYEGVYRRTAAFTWIISKLTPYFSWNLLVPRLPAVIAGSLQVALTFAWLRARTDWVAALAAALFLCLSRVAVEQSGYVRFYSIHALFFWLTAVAVYDLVHAPDLRRRLLALAVATVCLVTAKHLQSITLIGLAGIAVWGGWLVQRSPSLSRRTKTFIFVGAAIAIAAGIALIVLRPELFSHSIYEAAKSEQWNKDERWDLLYYVRYLISEYPLIMAGFFLAVGLGYREWPSLTVLCLSIAVVACLFLSVAGMKSPRYVLFAAPFVFTIGGLGVSAGWRLLARNMPAWGEGGRARVWHVIAGFTVVAALSASPGFATTITASLGGLKRAVLARSLLFGAPGDEPWQSQRAAIAAALAKRSVIVTTDEFRSLHYLGAFDVAIVPSYNMRNGKQDFSLDKRTGRPVVSTVRNVELVYGCYPTGAVLALADAWPAPVEIDPQVQTFLDQHTRHQVIAVKDAPFQAHVLSWDHPVSPSPECAALAQRVNQGHRPARETIDRIADEPGGGQISFRR